MSTQTGILVKASQTADKQYSYNVAAVVFCTELVKLLICSTWYVKKTSSISTLFRDCLQYRSVAYRYLIPAFLYCLYNNLAFVNLANYDPTTYFILLQLRNVITGVIYQILFQKQLTRMQWVSLFILTGGCIVKELGRGSDGLSLDGIVNYHLLTIILQLCCSCFAGVYNEYLLKDSHGPEVDILIQNIYMYADSILCNAVFILFSSWNISSSSLPSPSATASVEEVSSLMDLSFLERPVIWAIMLNGAIAGITTSFFLKSLNSILKTFAATIEIVISAIVCWFIFSIPIDRYTFASVMIIFFAIYIYSRKPMTLQQSPGNSSTLPVSYKHVQTDDTDILIEDTDDDDLADVLDDILSRDKHAKQ